jgi:hypothetical protein
LNLSTSDLSTSDLSTSDLSTATSIDVTTPTQTGSPSCTSALIDASHPERKRVEAFIAQRFLEVHGAQITGFMPQLLALFDAQDAVLAAVGMRDASLERLFLEYYLDIPVEQAIADQAAGQPTDQLAQGHINVERERIVEIGNLASIDRLASRKLFRILAHRLSACDYQWAVFTGCSSLQRMFATLGIETLGLGRALQSRLPADQQTWGGYYEDNPLVVAGRVGHGRRVFDQLTVAA